MAGFPDICFCFQQDFTNWKSGLFCSKLKALEGNDRDIP